MREIKLPKEKSRLLNNLTKMIEKKLGMDNYLITEADIAEKYNVEVDEVILKEKEAIPFETESSPKIRRVKILNNFWNKGLNYYKENNNGLNSDFTDALIVKESKILFGLRSKNSKIEPNKWGLLGSGHLETFLTPEKNVLKEIKEETGLDIISCKLINVRNLKGNKKIYYFFCIPVNNQEVILNQSEHQNYKWMSIQDIKEIPAEKFMFDLKEYILKLLGHED